MGREPKTKVIDGVTVVSAPLPPMKALDLMAELSGLLGTGAASGTDAGAMLAMLGALGRGKVRDLLPRLLACTSVTVTDSGAPTRIEMSSPEAIDLAFDGRMSAFPQVVAFAVEVSFGDFFAGLARVGNATPTP